MNPGDRGKNGMLGIVESVTYGPHSRGQGTTLSSSTNYSILKSAGAEGCIQRRPCYSEVESSQPMRL